MFRPGKNLTINMPEVTWWYEKRNMENWLCIFRLSVKLGAHDWTE